jgi:hypothetical protein
LTPAYRKSEKENVGETNLMKLEEATFEEGPD